MKNLQIALLIGFVFLLVHGCKTSDNITEQPQRHSQTLQAEKPVVWKQSLCPSIDIGDPVNYLNSTKIVVDGDFLNQVFILDGGIHRKDSVLNVLRKVPKWTPGKFFEKTKSKDGKFQIMGISFDVNDATYHFYFYLKSDETFTLNANAELIYKGISHKIQATTIGGECLLLVYYDIETFTETDEGEAVGVSTSGTKIIKVKK